MDKQAAFRGIIFNSPGTHDGVLVLREKERERGRERGRGKEGEKGREGGRRREGVKDKQSEGGRH